MIQNQTLLDAINSMLSFVGISTLNSFDEMIDSDSVKASTMLESTSRIIQSTGWECNREENLSLRRDDATLRFAIPVTFLAVDSTGGEDIVLRGGFLYDKTTHSFEFPDTSELSVDIIRQLELMDLPVALREYIIIKAKRAFQNDVIGDPTKDALAANEEKEAFERLGDDELDQGDYNMLKDSLSQTIKGENSSGLS